MTMETTIGAQKPKPWNRPKKEREYTISQTLSKSVRLSSYNDLEDYNWKNVLLTNRIMLPSDVMRKCSAFMIRNYKQLPEDQQRELLLLLSQLEDWIVDEETWAE